VEHASLFFLQVKHAPLHAVSLSALQRGQRTSLLDEGSPHDGHVVTEAI
jgi:hypothetical protein